MLIHMYVGRECKHSYIYISLYTEYITNLFVHLLFRQLVGQILRSAGCYPPSWGTGAVRAIFHLLVAGCNSERQLHQISICKHKNKIIFHVCTFYICREIIVTYQYFQYSLHSYVNYLFGEIHSRIERV